MKEKCEVTNVANKPWQFTPVCLQMAHLRSALNSVCISWVPECIPRAVRTLRTGTCAKLQRLRSTRLPQGVRNCTNSTLVNSIFTGHLLRLDSTLYVLISLRVTTAVVANRLPETNYALAQKQTSTVMKYWPMMWIIECWDLFPPCRSSRRCRDRKTPWWRQSCFYVRLLALEWTRVLVEEPLLLSPVLPSVYEAFFRVL